jgi:arginyl-tRNA synthetase
MDFKEKIAELVAEQTKLKKQEVLSLLAIPPSGMGDYTFPCFVLAKEQKKNPVQLAEQLSKKIDSRFLEKVEAKGPYLNFFVAKESLSASVLGEILSEKIFKTQFRNKEKIMVEYSGPNTNKPLHLGHLRNNSLGLAISNLLETTGFEVIKANLINDRGVHICKSMAAYKYLAPERNPEKEKIKPDHFIGEMYVLYSEELKKNPAFEQKATELLKKWEEGDKETIALWKKMNEWAIEGMKETYKTFGSKFDVWFLESEMFKKQKGKQIIEEGLKKGAFKREENGAISAILEPELPNKILLRGDGTSLYATNDLGVTQEKFDEYKLDSSIWVVGNEQDLYLKQLFTIFKKLGRKWAGKCKHMSYGMVNLTTGKMKSREGTVVDADDLIKETKELALDEIETRYKGLEKAEKEKRALSIALAGIKFYLLKNDAKKEITFNPKESVAFEGETGPYLQYAYARAKSILRKAKQEKIRLPKPKKELFEMLTQEKEKELITEMAKYSDSIKRSYTELSLHPLCHNLLAIAEKFNSYYHETQILKAENEELRDARILLVEAVTKILEKGLGILDIEAIEEM